MGGARGRVSRPRRRARRGVRPRQRGPRPRRLGGEAPHVGCRREARNPQGVLGDARRHPRRRARAHGRWRRPHREHRHRAEGEVARHARRLHRPPDPLRRARARHGLDHERNGPVGRCAPLRWDVPDLQRLRTPGRAPGGTVGRQGRVRLVTRLRRSRRGRSDAPAGRAPDVAAGDPQAPGDPSRRCQRGAARVARPHQRRRADRDRPHAPERARARGHRRARARGPSPGRVHARRRDR
jgi:hypothetical protein